MTAWDILLIIVSCLLIVIIILQESNEDANSDWIKENHQSSQAQSDTQKPDLIEQPDMTDLSGYLILNDEEITQVSLLCTKMGTVKDIPAAKKLVEQLKEIIGEKKMEDGVLDSSKYDALKEESVRLQEYVDQCLAAEHATEAIDAETLKTITNHCKENCTVYRIGGDEFVFIGNVKSEIDVDQMIKKFLNTIGDDTTVAYGYSVSYDAEPLIKTFKLADNNMYLCKEKIKRKKSLEQR